MRRVRSRILSSVVGKPEFGSVRVVMIDGEPWFVGKDVATALGYSNQRDALKRHVDDEDKQGSRITTHGSEATLINESGMYSLILSSKLDSARQFKRWVTSEVLPSIRKTGSYIGGDVQQIVSPEFLRHKHAVIDDDDIWVAFITVTNRYGIFIFAVDVHCAFDLHCRFDGAAYLRRRHSFIVALINLSPRRFSLAF